MDPAGSGNDLIFPAQVALYGEPRDPREGSGPSPDPRPTSSLRPGPNANGPGHAFASPPSRRAIRRFPTGIRLLPPSYIPEKTFPARGTSAQSFTPPTKLPTFPKRRSPSGAPGSVATGDLSYTREASSLHGMRKRPTNLSHARGASVTPSAGQPCKKPFPCGRHRRKRFSSPAPLSYARGGILHNTLIILEECSLSCARVGHIPRHLRERSGHPLSYARGGILRPFRIKRQCALSYARGASGKGRGRTLLRGPFLRAGLLPSLPSPPFSARGPRPQSGGTATPCRTFPRRAFPPAREGSRPAPVRLRPARLPGSDASAFRDGRLLSATGGLLRFRTLSALPQFPQVFRRVHEASHRPGSSSQRSRRRIGSSLTATDNH